MSRTTQQNPLIPAKPTTITLDTLPELFAHYRAQFGGWSMTSTPPEPTPPAPPAPAPPAPPQPAQRPDGISEAEWNALGDPGRVALVREREARTAAERALAASRARPTPPGPTPPAPPAAPPKPPAPSSGGGDPPDIAAIIEQAVAKAVQPFQEAEQRRVTEDAAEQIRQAVVDAAKDRLHDATDALTGIDLTTVVNAEGGADADKIKTALDDLVTRKPHLARPTPRVAPPGIGGGAPANATDAEKVKAVLADMQRATGVRPPATAAVPSTP